MVHFDGHGAVINAYNLNHTFRFEQLGFEVKVFNDLKREDVLEIIKEGMRTKTDSFPRNLRIYLQYTHFPVVLLSH